MQVRFDSEFNLRRIHFSLNLNSNLGSQNSLSKMLFGKYTRRKVKQKFRGLIAFAFADSCLKTEELALLKYKADKLGIGPEEFEELMNGVRSGNTEQIFIPKGNNEKVQQLVELIEVALVDGEFTEEEWEYFLKIGHVLGYSLGEIEHIVKKSFKLSIPKIFYDRLNGEDMALTTHK